MPPRVTIITATYNRPDCLRLALESLLRQSYTEFESWVIGDGCTAETAEVVATFGDPRLHYHNRAENSGSQAAPNNDGLSRATGELIAYLGHDDLWLPWHLAGLVEELDATGADLVHSLAARIAGEGVVNCVGLPGPGESYRDIAFCPPSSWLHLRAPMEAVGGWPNPDLIARGVDREMVRRLVDHGCRIVCRPQVTVLKFPSHHAACNYQSGAAIQTPWAAAVREDPDALEHQLLTAVAERFARHRCPAPGFSGLMRRAGRLLSDGLVRLYGEDRWPLRPWLVRQCQRARARKARVRGLPPRPKQGRPGA